MLDTAMEMVIGARPAYLWDIYEFCFEALCSMRDAAGPSVLDVSFDELSSIKQAESLRAFLLEAISLFVSNEAPADKKHSVLVEKGIALLEEKYNSNLSLDEICEYLSVSKNYFSYLFKRDTDISLWAYLTDLRIGKAKILLETTDMKSYEVAYKVGYENPSYFTKLFKKHAGVTPNEYRTEAAGRRDSI